ncbi:TPA: tyrosine-type recombinase/integrase [Serratia marcescens]
MSIKSLGAEGYMVDVRPQGREGKRVRKKFKTKSGAQQFERWIIATQNNKEWLDKPADHRPLTDLIDLWWNHHGQHLKDGVKRAQKLRVMAEKMGLPGDHLKAVRLCLATGARWGEVAKLRKEEVIGYKVTYLNTKNNKNRTVPISPELCKEITSGVKSGPLFKDLNYPYVRLCVKEVAPGLSAGQAVHVLRHTFASHFMMNGGNILALQRILGHSSILQTMVYAHFAPDYLEDAVRFNPLSELKPRKIT